MSPSHKFEILEGLPPYGPLAESFAAARGSSSEGFVVRFFPDQGESWVGNFPAGSSRRNVVFEHPNKRDFIVVAGGDGYVIDPVTRQCSNRFGGDIDTIISLPELTAIVFGNGLWFEALGTNGYLWRSKRISWDGIQNIKQEGLLLSGEAWSPPDDCWYPFSLDLQSGEFTGGSYSFPE